MKEGGIWKWKGGVYCRGEGDLREVEREGANLVEVEVEKYEFFIGVVSSSAKRKRMKREKIFVFSQG